MNDEKNGMNMDAEQSRQFFTVAVEQPVNPEFDEQSRRMDEQNLQMENLSIDTRIAIGESKPDRLEGAGAIPSLHLLAGFLLGAWPSCASSESNPLPNLSDLPWNISLIPENQGLEQVLISVQKNPEREL
ncbi:MAG: hypothetical protein ISN28_15630 [Ectothiorhodospiraceae bacterium AqS1]|nr:hypothetical protein [Ectothiorhodospiraceae bacterium AqS1]MBF2761663.1 hypothetical protein [Ectothiorhodospiraceae bacterium AqS1]